MQCEDSRNEPVESFVLSLYNSEVEWVEIYTWKLIELLVLNSFIYLQIKVYCDTRRPMPNHFSLFYLWLGHHTPWSLRARSFNKVPPHFWSFKTRMIIIKHQVESRSLRDRAIIRADRSGKLTSSFTCTTRQSERHSIVKTSLSSTTTRINIQRSS